jgi:hypothetical protein
VNCVLQPKKMLELNLELLKDYFWGHAKIKLRSMAYIQFNPFRQQLDSLNMSRLAKDYAELWLLSVSAGRERYM